VENLWNWITLFMKEFFERDDLFDFHVFTTTLEVIRSVLCDSFEVLSAEISFSQKICSILILKS